MTRSHTTPQASSAGVPAGRRVRGGFTLVEMLVVIAIISILGGLTLAALGKARTTSKEKAVQALFLKLKAALDRYEMDFQDYPPSEGDMEGMVGAESLMRCLKTEYKGGPYIDDSDVKSVDSNSNGEFEIADEWNQPIRYIHHRDYRNTPPNKRTFRLMSAGPDRVFENGMQGTDDVVNWNKDKPD